MFREGERADDNTNTDDKRGSPARGELPYKSTGAFLEKKSIGNYNLTYTHNNSRRFALHIPASEARNKERGPLRYPQR